MDRRAIWDELTILLVDDDLGLLLHQTGDGLGVSPAGPHHVGEPVLNALGLGVDHQLPREDGLVLGADFGILRRLPHFLEYLRLREAGTTPDQSALNRAEPGLRGRACG